ncbi:PREDICTED: putative mediator of RNA polymerase II transcription subunit 26 [Drosophila arizonae]|uniref:Mediator of RNA polymerase II transcription subunit 26 n=1 Tax=Drosophila arizonae TaxID=7263 RepID=A0ABM1PFC5_DROAR|nr:PREDICTED: putative mediator of RNA polymerase II transcription subunit 26 [Drosophila arizonae]
MMVRRRGMGAGLSAFQQPPPQQHPVQQQMGHLNMSWLSGATPQWTPRRDTFVSNVCNKMVGAVPRMPKLRAPEPSSRKLSRLRRNLMNISPQFTSTANWQQPVQRAQPKLWYSSNTHIQPNSPLWSHSIMTAYAKGQQQTINDISVQLKQQLRQLRQQCLRNQQQQQQQQQRQLHKQQQQQQQQRQQQQQHQQQRQQQQRQQHHKHFKPSFVPFNFGKCANNLISCLESNAAFAHKQAANLNAMQQQQQHQQPQQQQQQQQHMQQQHMQQQPPQLPPQDAYSFTDGFNYVKLAKHMAKKIMESPEIAPKSPVASKSNPSSKTTS